LALEPTAKAPQRAAEAVFAAYLPGWHRVVGGTRAPVLDAKRRKLIAADCYVDHVVCQQGAWTTAFHGSFPGCTWEDIAHESISTLLATVDGKPNLAAGQLYDIGNTTTLIVSSVQ
jgi:hypothetical protein